MCKLLLSEYRLETENDRYVILAHPMFTDHDPPVSLFSFQDIITSLTGIMIFFLLLLSLYLMESTQKKQEESPIYRELAQIQAKNAILKKQISEISSDIRNYRKRIQTAQKQDESALKLKRFRLEKDIRDLKSQQVDLNKKIKESKDSCSRLEKESQELDRQVKELAQKQKQCDTLAKEISQKKQKIAETRAKLEKRKKEVQVTIDSSINKIPVLIECSIDKICILDTKEKKQRIFTRQSPIISDLIANAMSYLRDFSPGRYYFVFIVKPSAAHYISFFQRTFREEMKNADSGVEPILEKEGMAHE